MAKAASSKAKTPAKKATSKKAAATGKKAAATSKKSSKTAVTAKASKPTTATKAVKATKAAKVIKEAPVQKPADGTKDKIELKVETTLNALYGLQQIDSHIDKIRSIRGELPLEVQDLEDEIIGLETRVSNYKGEVDSIDKSIQDKQQSIKDSESLIKKYKDQQMNVRNNREYDSLSKEVEFQTLEIQLSEKRINECKLELVSKKEEIEKSDYLLDERRKDLEMKKSELTDIVTETEREEDDLLTKSEGNQKKIEDRLLVAYQRIRKNARNGLAVVKIERDACGGCFNKIPPQHQLDIRMHKKIIVCEYCGRILVDDNIAKTVDIV